MMKRIPSKEYRKGVDVKVNFEQLSSLSLSSFFLLAAAAVVIVSQFTYVAGLPTLALKM